jgi:hypothetical protein
MATRGSGAARRGTASTVTFALLVLGNGFLLPLVAYYLRHVTMASSTWRACLIWSLMVGVAVPLLIIGAVTVVSVIARDPNHSARLMVFFGLFWSAPGLVSNHNAISDLRHGPQSIHERVRDAARFDKSSGGGVSSRTWHYCTLTFDDGSKHTLDRYAVEYAYLDPCHGIRAGDRIRLVKLPHIDELIAIDALGSNGT